MSLSERGFKQADNPKAHAEKTAKAVGELSLPNLGAEVAMIAIGMQATGTGHDELTVHALRIIADTLEAQIQEDNQ